MTVERVTFRDITHGLPALAEWLCHHGCKDIDYTIQVRNFSLGPEDDLVP